MNSFAKNKFSSRDVDCESDLEPLTLNAHPTISNVERGKDRLFRIGWSNVAVGILLLITLGLTVALFECGRHDDPVVKLDSNVLASFLVVGDWGRQGQYNQSAVATSMATVADTLHPQFVISTGDNFYPHGLNSTEDALFDISFREVYKAASLQVPWYAVLGNHDYGDMHSPDAEACLEMEGGCPISPLYQLNVRLVERDSRWRCSRQYKMSVADGAVDFFFMDTSPFIQRYWDKPWAKFEGGVLQQSWESSLRELETLMARSSAPWKILVAHHPMRSNGEHGNTKEMLLYVEPLLQRYGVRLALHGHDHDLEHVHVSGQAQHYVVSGAGSKIRALNGTQDTVFQYGMQGFVAVTIKKDDLLLQFYGIDKTSPLYEEHIPRVMSEAGW